MADNPDAGLPGRRALERGIRPTRVELDLDALRGNLAQVRALAPGAEVLAVVKANGYGHGAVPCARALERQGVRFLGVALIEEGLELRNAGIRAPILVLSGAYEGGYELLVEHDLTPTLFRPEHLTGLGQAARKLGRTVDFHVKLDTGMGRIGLLPHELEGFLDEATRTPGVRLDGVLSHFANADLADPAVTSEQVRRFKAAVARMRERGFSPSFRHLSNSAGVVSLPEVRDGLELNLVRPGLMLYGLAPAEWMREKVALSPVLTWKTGIIHLKRVAEGTPISYGGTWVARRESLVATLPLGYADGYSRMHSNRAQVLVRGRRAPIAGRVCMDLCMVDVTDVPGVAVGDEVVLLGEQGGERITAEELARLSQTIHYEVICAVGARVPRRVKG
ncbi:MAG TPA: alanine racemase [Myxococcaceae bacterium]|nr:alanine racemase [Myxococcaceae bacterium]